MEKIKKRNHKEKQIDNKLELRKFIAMMRTDDYGMDLGKEIYISEKDVYKNYLLKIS